MTQNTEPNKYRSKTQDELGIHILKELAAMDHEDLERAANIFEEIGFDIAMINNMLALDSSQARTMKKSRGVFVSIDPETTRKHEWLVRAFRDPIRIKRLTEDGTMLFAIAYLHNVQDIVVWVREQLIDTKLGGGDADLACNRGLRQYYIKSLRILSDDLDFELVYNVFANSNLSGDPTKPDWQDLIDQSPDPNKPKPPGGRGPNNGGTPKGALVPLPQLNTVAVAA